MASISSAASGSAAYYMGCKISLISKSDIRYEGVLYSLDQEASTVALSNVHSFGTEDRRPDAPIAGRDQTYEYILFRGSDIKDIVVCEPPRAELFVRRPDSQLTDPAILEVSAPPAAPASSQNPLGALTANRLPGHGHSSLPTTSSLHSQTHAGAIGVHVPPILYSNTAAPPVRSQQPTQRSQATATRHDDKDRADDTPANQHNYGQRRQESLRYRDDEEGYSGARYRDEGRGYASRGGGYGADRDDRDQYQGGPRGGYSGRARYIHGQGYGGGGGGGGEYQTRGGYQSRGGYNNRGFPRPGFNGRRNDSYQQSTGLSSNSQRENAASTNVPLTKESMPEYDFENAEKVFHELESQAKKLNLNDTAGDGSAGENGDSKQDENSPHDPAKFYDPNSFFDKISCEALEKEKNAGQRPDWKRERLVNTETFGTAGNVSRHFNNQNQGRGGYRGYNSRGGGAAGNYGGQRSQNADQQHGGGYDNSNSYEDGYSRGNGYRPRGGSRYNNSGYPSRNFGPSQPRQTQNGGLRPEEYFRCPSTQLRRRSPVDRYGGYNERSVRFEEDDWTYDERYYGPSHTSRAGPPGGGRRRNEENETGVVAGGRRSLRKEEQSGVGGATGQAQQPRRGRSGRNFRNRSRGGAQNAATATATAEVAASGGQTQTREGQASAAPTGQRKRGGQRKKDEWVEYAIPSNCKDLLPKITATLDAAEAKKDAPSTPNLESQSHAAGNKEMKQMKSSDWTLVDSASATGDMGQTGVKLEGDGNEHGIEC